MADLVIFGEWTNSGTRVQLPLGSYYFQYSVSYDGQGDITVRCAGSTSSNVHDVTGYVEGGARILLTDMDTAEITTVVNDNRPVSGVFLKDATHKYKLSMDHDGGSATVVCPICGTTNHIHATSTAMFRALGTYDAKIRTQPTSKTVYVNSNATFTIETIHTKYYQWQIGEWNTTDSAYIWNNLSDGELDKGVVVSGATTDTLTFSYCRSAYSGISVRCVLTGFTGNILTSDEVPLVIRDNLPPTVSVTVSPITKTKGPVTITITAKDIDSGLPTRPYSFDNGAHYQESNQYIVTKNQSVPMVIVDRNGNAYRTSRIIDYIIESAPNGYIGINDKAKLITKGYVGIDGKARPLTAGYVGVNNIAKRIYYFEVPYKVPSFSSATDAQITKALEKHRAGEIDLTEYWSVGDERTIHLSAMAATGVGEFHVEQDQTLVILHGSDCYELSDGGKNIFVIGLKNLLCKGNTLEDGYINSNSTNVGGWKDSARRTWCDDVFMKALPTEVQKWFKKFKYISSDGNQLTTSSEMENYFTFPSRSEVLGPDSVFTPVSEDTTQLKYYETKENILKYIGESGSYGSYWLRSPYMYSSSAFCSISFDGYLNANPSEHKRGLSPFGCV